LNKRRVFIGIFLVIFLGAWGIYENWPVVQSEAKIRKKMLKKFPMGTDRTIVWKYAQKVDPGMYGAYTDNLGWWLNNDQSSSITIGESRIRATVAKLAPIYVDVIWLFDTQDKLIETYAWKTMDMP
jgi:hypothetical protein